jgi:phospholipase/carboxylesterase
MEAKQYDGRSLRYLVVEPDEFDPDRAYPLIILLHGFGSNMSDLAGLTPTIGRVGYLYACPNAPLAMDIGGGQVGYAWANLYGDSYEREAQDAENLLIDFVQELTQQYKVTPDRVMLGGFSQGGMLTYRVGLPRPEMFAGLFALSSRVTDPDGLRSRLPERRDQAIFVSHGTQDTMISVDDGRESRRLLGEWGYDVEYHEYEMGHEIRQEVIDDSLKWLSKVMPPLV